MNELLSSTPNAIEQKIEGDNNQQAARDIINNLYPQQDVKMKSLIEAYKQEQLENKEFSQVLEELDYYLNPVKAESQNIIGLKKKLTDGQFDELVDYAMEMKELFYRKVERYRLSESAQKIFLYILADVQNKFNHKIYPLICNDTSHQIIMEKIEEEIINVINEKLGENVLDIFPNSISGMVYFLTGNCHIKWSKQ